MTNLEALKSQSAILANVPDNALEFQLEEQSLNGDEAYVPANRKAIDMAFAGLLLFVCTQASSLKELDWGITNVSVSDLLKIRRSILSKWGVHDETGPMIKGVSPW